MGGNLVELVNEGMKRSAVHFTGLSGHSVENGDGRDASRETCEKAGASVSDEEQA